jgi:type I restriction enzyme M protein
LAERVPPGVFEPYTPIETNILFFDRSGVTEEVWFYEHQIGEGRKKYTKTAPLTHAELLPCVVWWRKRAAGPTAWKVAVSELAAGGYNLDLKNPNRSDEGASLSAKEAIKEALALEERIVEELRTLQALAREIP